MIKKNALKKSGTFRNKFPDLFNELHPTKNNHIDFEKVTPHSHIRVWWICKKSHIWDSRLNNRTSNNRGCPKCKQNTSKIELRFYCELKKIFKRMNNDKMKGKGINSSEMDIILTNVCLADDEGDPGMGYELGIDFFCSYPMFQKQVKYLFFFCLVVFID